MADRTLVGHVGVDSGKVMVLDPAYLGSWAHDDFDPELARNAEADATLELPFSYSGSCAASFRDPGSMLGELAAAVVRSGFGDGLYPVYAEYATVDLGQPTRVVARLVVEFLVGDDRA